MFLSSEGSGIDELAVLASKRIESSCQKMAADTGKHQNPFQFLQVFCDKVL